jgi:hypothetical protein
MHDSGDGKKPADEDVKLISPVLPFTTAGRGGGVGVGVAGLCSTHNICSVGVVHTIYAVLASCTQYMQCWRRAHNTCSVGVVYTLHAALASCTQYMQCWRRAHNTCSVGVVHTIHAVLASCTHYMQSCSQHCTKVRGGGRDRERGGRRGSSCEVQCSSAAELHASAVLTTDGEIQSVDHSTEVSEVVVRDLDSGRCVCFVVTEPPLRAVRVEQSNLHTR